MSRLKTNITYNLVYQILAIILPFITAPYLSRVVGANGIGIYSFSHSIALYFTYFTLLGLNNYGNRSIASLQNDRRARSKAFCEIYAMQCLCFLICIVGYAIYIIFFSRDRIAAVIMGIMVISSAFDINWFFFGLEQFKLTVVRNSIVKILTVICIFVFVKTQDDIYVYIAIMSVGTLLSQLCLWPFIKKFCDFCVPSFKDILKHFKPNIILFVPVVAISIYKIMDKVFLGYMSTMEEVGFYENAERVITIAATMITAVGTVMMPRTTLLLSENKQIESKEFFDKSMLLVIAYCNAVVFGIFAVAKEFSIVFYGDGFEKTGIIMIYLAITVLFLGCGNVIQTQFLIPNKKDSVFIKSAILGAIINAIINVLLIPQYAAIGAAIGTICAEFSVLFYKSYHCRHEIGYKKFLKWQIVFMIIGLIMWGVIRLIPDIDDKIIQLLVHVVSGGIVYVALAAVYIYKVEKIQIKIKKVKF